ncbi:phosphoribosylamine--glycine ligase [bacterium]|nr:phosphoribosylamine--glycine ligase [bacterium]
MVKKNRRNATQYMKIGVVGSGGREHTLAWAFELFGHEVLVSPGNGGTSHLNQFDLNVGDNSFDLVVIGPEQPLADGLADTIRSKGIPVFGPNKNGALLEGSKSFARDFCKKHKVASPENITFSRLDEALKHIEKTNGPWFIKADGLAGGKGAFPAENKKTAKEILLNLMEKKALGKAGNIVVIEEWMIGPELSVHVLVNGNSSPKILHFSRDHKRRFDHDKGPNTGGMGAYSPVEDMNNPKNESLLKLIDPLVKNSINGLEKDNIDYRGVLYLGMMLTKNGPKLLEYNVRFGDPETQVLIPLMNGDPAEHFLKIAKNEKIKQNIKSIDKAALTVVLADNGYPEKTTKNIELVDPGMPKNPEPGNALVFHAGTKKEKGKLFSNGGRIFNVTGIGKNLNQAKSIAYAEINRIKVEGTSFRNDIAVNIK